MDKGFGKKSLVNWLNVVLHMTFVLDVIMAYRIFTRELVRGNDELRCRLNDSWTSCVQRNLG